MKRSFSRLLAVGAVAALLLTAVGMFAPGRAAAAGQVAIRSRICPTTFDGSNATINDLGPRCIDLGVGVTVSLSHDNTPVATQKISETGEVFFDNFSTGEAEIDQTPPDGYTVRAFCAVYAPTGTRVYSEYSIPVRLLVGDGKRLECIFYNVPINPAPSSTIYINKHNCPDGAFADMNELAAGCKEKGVDGIFFTLTDANNGSTTHETSGGIVSWSSLPEGAYTATERFPGGYSSARVFCNTKNSAGDETGFSEIDATGGKINLTTKAGYDAFCDWYDFRGVKSTATATPTATATTGNGTPTSVTPTPNSTPEPTGPAALTITAYTCKPGYNVFASSAKPRTDCPAVAANVTFTLSGDAKLVKKQQTDAAGKGVFGNLKPGAYSLTLTFPTGVTSAFVASCTSNVRDFTDYPYIPFARVGTSGKLGVTLLPGEQLSCAWYDVPTKSAATPAAAQ